MTHPANGPEATGGPSTQIRAYTFFMTVLSAALLVRLMAYPALASEDAKQVASVGQALALMSLGGALGGCLYSLRRLSLHSAAGDYFAGHDFSYYARPLSSAISGLTVCLLLLAGALTLTTGSGNSPGWLTFSGRMPCLGCSLLAGYSGHKFMRKLNGLADYIFAVNKQDRTPGGRAAAASTRKPRPEETVLASQRMPGRAA